MSRFRHFTLLLMLLLPTLASAQTRWDSVGWPTPKLDMHPNLMYIELGRGLLNLPEGNGVGASSFMLGYQVCDFIRLEGRGVLSDGFISGRGDVRTVCYTMGIAPIFRLTSPPVFKRGAEAMGLLYPFLSLSVGSGIRKGYIRDVKVRESVIHCGFRAGWHLFSWLDFYMGYDFYAFPQSGLRDEKSSGFASAGVRFCLF